MKYQNSIIMCGDFNGQIGCNRGSYVGNLGIDSIDDKSEVGKTVLDFSLNL